MKEACLLLPSLSDVFPLGQRARHNWRKTHYFLYLHMYLQNMFTFLFCHDILSFNINLIGYIHFLSPREVFHLYIHLFILCCAHFLSAGIPLIRGRESHTPTTASSSITTKNHCSIYTDTFSILLLIRYKHVSYALLCIWSLMLGIFVIPQKLLPKTQRMLHWIGLILSLETITFPWFDYQ